MKKLMITAAFLLFGCQTQTVDTEAYLHDAQKTTQAFTQQLGSTLKQQIESQGVVSAIPFCKQVAPAIAQQHSTDKKTVVRVSKKARNQQQGIPDAWEEQVLQDFAQQLSTEPTKDKLAKANLAFGQIVTENNARYYRYAKAIQVQKMCLACHGKAEQISSEVLSALNQHYPNDIARDYEIGDLRGAVSIKYKLD